jgi:DNA-binding MarR family transcriptional regulator
MSKWGGFPLTTRAVGSGGLCSSAAAALVSDMCLQAVAGKLAVRQLAAWARPFGVSETEFRLLWLLVSDGSVRGSSANDQADLAERLAVSAAQVSAVVERLRVAGLVEGDRQSSDRRRRLWRPTSQGFALVDGVVTRVAASGIPPVAPPCEGGGYEAEAAA